jgi:hypothetical protein
MPVQSHERRPRPMAIPRPTCPECKSTEMWIARIEPTDLPGYDRRTYECPRCQCSKVEIVKYR